MEGIAWGKLAYNLNNAVNALSGLTILEELKQRGYRRVFAAAIAEMTRPAPPRRNRAGQDRRGRPGQAAAHVSSLPDFLFRHIAPQEVQKIDPKGRGSMADDFDAGRKTEVDYLNGEVVRLAERLGREAPVNAAIVDAGQSRPKPAVERSGARPNCARHVLGTLSAAIFGLTALPPPAGIAPCGLLLTKGLSMRPFPARFHPRPYRVARARRLRRPPRDAPVRAGRRPPPRRCRASCRATSARSIIRSRPRPTPRTCASPAQVAIDIEVLEPTDTITLNAAELDFIALG